MGFLAAILNWNFRFQTSEFRLYIIKDPTELFYFYIDMYLFVKYKM